MGCIGATHASFFKIQPFLARIESVWYFLSPLGRVNHMKYSASIESNILQLLVPTVSNLKAQTQIYKLLPCSSFNFLEHVLTQLNCLYYSIYVHKPSLLGASQFIALCGTTQNSSFIDGAIL